MVSCQGTSFIDKTLDGFVCSVLSDTLAFFRELPVSEQFMGSGSNTDRYVLGRDRCLTFQAHEVSNIMDCYCCCRQAAESARELEAHRLELFHRRSHNAILEETLAEVWLRYWRSNEKTLERNRLNLLYDFDWLRSTSHVAFLWRPRTPCANMRLAFANTAYPLYSTPRVMSALVT